MIIVGLGPLASAAPLTAADEAKMAGKWIVMSGHSGKIQRLYDITPGRNIRIAGSDLHDRKGRLTPRPDGTYFFKLEDDSNIRLKYAASSDELIVEYYKGKKDLELGLKPQWTAKAKRKTD
jgi:hypothetical protein